NVLRRLRENRHQPKPRLAFQVVFDASIEVRSAVVYATFAVILVFVPILTMTGVAGRLFSPLGIAYISAVLASMLVALTLTPALCLVLLGKGKLPEEDPPVTRWLKDRYRSALMGVEKNYRTIIALVIIFTAAGLASLHFVGGEFLPELQEGHFILHMTAAPGTSIAESLRLGNRVTEELLKISTVRSIDQRVGRAEKGDDWLGPHQSEFDVNLKPLTVDEAESTQADIRKALSRFVGVDFSMNTFLSERVEETISGYPSAFVVRIFGNDLRTLDTTAQAVTDTLKRIPGATDVMIQSRSGTPQLVVRLRKPDLLRWGFDPVDVLDAIRTAYNGDVVGQVYEGNRIFNVSVIWDPAKRKTPSQLRMLTLRNMAGTYVHLQQLADIHEVSGRYEILHEGARRVQVVTCNAVGPDLGSLVAQAKRRIRSEISLPPGMYIEFSGAAEAQAQSQRALIFHSLLAGAGIVMLLAMVIRNFPNFVLLFLNLPFAMVGGMLAVFASGGVLSIGSALGFITLFGITLRNSIMLLSHWGNLVSVEGMKWGFPASAKGAIERLSPILMTATVTALGLLPMAIGSGAAGREIEGPMAIVILGGLITSTSLNLLVLPSLAHRYGRFEKPSAEI
ncbi:MAG: efflux RND transporter permease subunit, partial [Desulfomonilaceae bacterium]